MSTDQPKSIAIQDISANLCYNKCKGNDKKRPKPLHLEGTDMYRYSNGQISLSDFQQPMGMCLREDNRWVKKAQLLPWNNGCACGCPVHSAAESA